MMMMMMMMIVVVVVVVVVVTYFDLLGNFTFADFNKLEIIR
jgi:hypothetical protein